MTVYTRLVQYVKQEKQNDGLYQTGLLCKQEKQNDVIYQTGLICKTRETE